MVAAPSISFFSSISAFLASTSFAEFLPRWIACSLVAAPSISFFSSTSAFFASTAFAAFLPRCFDCSLVAAPLASPSRDRTSSRAFTTAALPLSRSAIDSGSTLSSGATSSSYVAFKRASSCFAASTLSMSAASIGFSM